MVKIPTYEYICDGCKEKLEMMQSIKARPKKKCPKCGKMKLKRIISGGGGVIFKGEGFYRSVDYINDKNADKDGRGSKNGLHTEQRKHKESL